MCACSLQLLTEGPDWNPRYITENSFYIKNLKTNYKPDPILKSNWMSRIRNAHTYWIVYQRSKFKLLGNRNVHLGFVSHLLIAVLPHLDLFGTHPTLYLHITCANNVSCLLISTAKYLPADAFARYYTVSPLHIFYYQNHNPNELYCRYVWTYEEFVFVTEANRITIYKLTIVCTGI